MQDENIELLKNYPKCSQDFNAIETAWRELRARLYDTEPVAIESREEFITRARNGVAWVNKNRAGKLRELCDNQKVRARDCLAATPPGARTDH